MQLLEQLAELLSERKRLDVVVSYKTRKGKDRIIGAEYDTFFKSVDLGSAIVPIRELKDWLRMTARADIETINVKVVEAQSPN